MAEQGAHVDTAALRAVADQFDRVAELVERAARVQPRFGGSVAGRAHTADGEAVRRAIELLTADLAQWSRAAAEIGACLRAGAQRYTDADAFAAAGMP